MALSWPDKDPDETLDYSIDWSAFLGDATISNVQWAVKSNAFKPETNINPGQTITNISSNAVIDDIMLVSKTNTNNVASAYIGGGLNSETYVFYCTITDSLSRTSQRAIKLKVKDR
ncbi:MAG: hypothetical protein CBC83_02350 [Flavobacteriales bacterium TMED123]|nr:hypothetical protein [Candidatus Neomarinimicrobiota bacterium]MAJ44523.1 hypothetical protein [Candidatus Neomarinimicrobiota bacterium]OUV73959.1 MAG: hypothetical protein CBC83_04795 [Flavobacteriales bacterium TMED123]OUV75600.1 MAG: hypothetical protein CBC83_02350 [Flavobacteriales bacterium TMED123]|tara:strand:+ start:4328 stop:4675 length:348 start_codon:yes stop_codon:yes gene_type:complete